MAATRKMNAITQWSHFQSSAICAAMNSLMQPNTNRAPIRNPTVATEVASNRSTMTAMSIHARPVMRNTHHGTSDHPPMAPRPRASISAMRTPSSIHGGRAAAHGILPQARARFHHLGGEVEASRNGSGGAFVPLAALLGLVLARDEGGVDPGEDDVAVHEAARDV